MRYNKFGPYWGLPSYQYAPFGPDSKAGYRANRTEQGPDWYFTNRIFSYERNSQGHRCRADIDYSRYILFTGCSLTEGTGNALEDTYAYKTSQALNIDYYNLALPAFLLDNPAPLLIVVQEASPFRWAIELADDIVPCGPWLIEGQLGNTITDDRIYADYTQAALEGKQCPLNISTQVPLIHISDDDFVIRDLARDLQHPGPWSHADLALTLVAKILNTGLL